MEWARERGLGRYFGSSLKGEASIDWDDLEARGKFLEGVATEADGLLEMARTALERIPSGDPGRERLHDAAALLERLLLQDIERREDAPQIKQAVSPDRVLSVHDPEMRHGRKSAKRRFDGHKVAVAVDPEGQLITAADVLAGNAADHERALELVEQSEANASAVVEETVGDCAYGSGDTRKTFADAGRRLTAKAATRRRSAQFPKEDFRIDLESMSCVCPAGQKTQKVVSISSGDRYGAPGAPLRAFRVDAERLRRMPAQVFVHAGAARKGSAGYDPPAGGYAPGGEGIPAKRGVRAVSQAAPGGRAQAGPTDATRRAPSPLLRAGKDAFPAPYGRHRRQSHAHGDEGRPHARSQPPSDDHLYTSLRSVYGSPRVRYSVVPLGAWLFGHASRAVRALLALSPSSDQLFRLNC